MVQARILIVDDSPAMRRSVAETVERFGAATVEAGDALDALRRFKADPKAFDLVTCDIEMPGMNGLELLRVVRELRPDQLVLMVTGQGDLSTALKAIHLGAYDYVMKPFDPADLDAAVRRGLDVAGLKRRNAELVAELSLKVQELSEARERMTRQERLAALGGLVAGLAHELNNPAGALSSNVAALREYAYDLGRLYERFQVLREAAARQGDLFKAELDEVRELERKVDVEFVLRDMGNLIDEMEGGGRRIAEVVRGLRALDSTVDQTTERVDLMPLVADACVRGGVGGDAGVEFAPFSGDALVEASSAQIVEAVAHIVRNAVQASPPAEAVRVHIDRTPGGVVVSVSDKGPGIPEETLHRIFEPFFTTRPVGSGMGLGLTIADAIVRAHGGRIEVETAAGSGSTFRVFLPAVDAAGAAADRAAVAEGRS
ncbi:MAG: response regulator [Nitrospirae bacterium]|nr:response regulator [Nitrospirota bacterium]